MHKRKSLKTKEKIIIGKGAKLCVTSHYWESHMPSMLG